MAWLKKSPRVRDTGWQVIQTAASGLAAPLPNDPIQSFRLRRVENRVIVDLSGLALDTTGLGLANLGQLPSWATAALPHQFFWVNDHPTSIHASQCAIYNGRVIYWTAQVLDGRIATNRPTQLRGGIEFTTFAPFPDELVVR